MPRFLTSLAFVCAVLVMTLVSQPSASVAQTESVSLFWQCFYPTCLDLRSVALNSATDGWAVGQGGTMLRLQNGQWRPWPSLTSLDLYDVTLVTPNQGWAVGGTGERRIALYWDGVSWSHYPFSFINPNEFAHQNAPRAVAQLGGRTWTVGQRSQAWELRRGEWYLLGRVGGQELDLTALALVGPDAGWAVGGKKDGASLASSAARLVGGQWNNFTMPGINGNPINYSALDFINADSGWAVGEYYDANPTVRDYRGAVVRYTTASGWQADTSTTTPLYGLSMLSDSQGWAVGWRYGISGPIAAYYQRQFGRWESVAGPESFAPLDLEVLAGGVGWAVGNNGALLRLQSGAWTAAGPQTSSNLNTTAFNESGGWAAGSNGTILRYGGGVWSPVTSPTRRGINDLKLTNGAGWAVGGVGTILRLSEGEWLLQTSPTTYNLQSIELTAADTGWAVGGGGTILRLQAGEWITTTPLVSSVLFDLALTGDSGWAVGGDDSSGRRYILRLENNEWSVVYNGPGQALQAVALAGNTGWAVGERGTILQLIDGAWIETPGPTQDSLYDVFAASSDLAWAVGQNGTLLEYSGGSWRRLPTVTAQPLFALTRAPNGQYWSVGAYGSILQAFSIRTQQYLPHVAQNYVKPTPTP